MKDISREPFQHESPPRRGLPLHQRLVDRRAKPAVLGRARGTCEALAAVRTGESSARRMKITQAIEPLSIITICSNGFPHGLGANRRGRSKTAAVSCAS